MLRDFAAGREADRLGNTDYLKRETLFVAQDYDRELVSILGKNLGIPCGVGSIGNHDPEAQRKVLQLHLTFPPYLPSSLPITSAPTKALFIRTPSAVFRRLNPTWIRSIGIPKARRTLVSSFDTRSLRLAKASQNFSFDQLQVTKGG